MGNTGRGRRLAGAAAVAVLALVACGDDDGAEPAAATETSDTSEAPASTSSTADRAPEVDVAPIGSRTLVDRPDDDPDAPKIQVLYLTPSDGPDDELDLGDVLTGSVASSQAWLEDQTGRRLRFDTFEGELDIVFHRLPRSADEYFAEDVYIRDAIEADLRAVGFDEADTMYAAYYAGPSADCASGFAPETLPGNTVVMYWTHVGPGGADCVVDDFAAADEAPGVWEFSLLHEVFHGLGAVGTCAPNHFEGHVGDLPNDLMYRGDESWFPDVVDVDRDDYWGHGRSDCPDLAQSAYLVD